MVLLKVGPAPNSDVGKKIVRISQTLMDKYGFSQDEIIEIFGEKRTGARIRPIEELKEWKDETRFTISVTDFDEEIEGILLMDGLVRTSIGASIDSIVRIDKTMSRPALQISLAPMHPTTMTSELSKDHFLQLKDLPIMNLDVVGIRGDINEPSTKKRRKRKKTSKKSSSGAKQSKLLG